MTSSRLQKRPTCGQHWPDDDEHATRAFGWVDPLPRKITVSNIDGIIHDGATGIDRFLVLESKHLSEPVKPGQLRLLKALAAVPNFAVRILRGTPEMMVKETVTPEGVFGAESMTAAAARAGIVRWIDPAYPVEVRTSVAPSAGRFDPFDELDVDWPA
jgi:hypothetical protein